MDKFKKFLLENYLNYRFPVYKNLSPFQDIKINNCHIIQLNEDKKIIYMNRIETQRYIQLIYEQLDLKISNLKRQYNLSAFKNNELIELVKSIDYNSYDDIVRFMEHKIIDMDTQKKLFQNKGNNIFLKSGIKLIKEGTELILDIKSKKKKLISQKKKLKNQLKKKIKIYFQ